MCKPCKVELPSPEEKRFSWRTLIGWFSWLFSVFVLVILLIAGRGLKPAIRDIQYCKNSKKALIKEIKEINKKFKSGEVSEKDYRNFFKQKIEGRTRLEWVAFCDKYAEDKGKEVKAKLMAKVKPLIPISLVVIGLFIGALLISSEHTGFTVVKEGVVEEVKESCYDGIKNQDEARADCGGVCKPCEMPAPLKDYGLLGMLFAGFVATLILAIILVKKRRRLY